VLKYRLTLALLFGIGFTALIALLLNAPLFAATILGSLLLTPGGILASLFFRSQDLGSPLAVLAVNSIIYSAMAYVAVRFWLHLDIRNAKLLALALAVPVLLLASLACMPSVSPLWPRGMTQLADDEKTLRTGLPLGSTLDAARAFLRGRAVNSQEYEIRSEEPILQSAHARIVAKPGDWLISALIDTKAEQFPCSYKIQVVLLFGAGQVLTEKYIERKPICP
jgi:hypothetical protein